MPVVRYWAAAKAAAGVAEEPVEAESLAAALDAVRRTHGPDLDRVLARSTYVVDGSPVGGRDHNAVVLGAESVVEVLPPFAGG